MTLFRASAYQVVLPLSGFYWMRSPGVKLAIVCLYFSEDEQLGWYLSTGD